MRRFFSAVAVVGLLSSFDILLHQDAAGNPPSDRVEPQYEDWKASGTRGAVVAGGAEAVAAGITVLKQEGNATDAAAAVILAQSVTDSKVFCFGGEVPILLLDRFGTISFTDIAAPTLAILDRHEETWHRDMAQTLRRLVRAEKDAEGDRKRGLRYVADGAQSACYGTFDH